MKKTIKSALSKGVYGSIKFSVDCYDNSASIGK